MSKYQNNPAARILAQMGLPVDRIPADGIMLETVDGTTYTFVWDEFLIGDDGKTVMTTPHDDLIRTHGHRARITVEML